jgi:hypothetical protein
MLNWMYIFLYWYLYSFTNYNVNPKMSAFFLVFKFCPIMLRKRFLSIDFNWRIKSINWTHAKLPEFRYKNRISSLYPIPHSKFQNPKSNKSVSH